MQELINCKNHNIQNCAFVGADSVCKSRFHYYINCGSLRVNVADNRNSSTNVGDSFPHKNKQKILCSTGSHIQEFNLHLTQRLNMMSLI